MPTPNDPQRATAVRKLTGELHLLQDRLNETIDQLCELLAGGDVAAALLAQPEKANGKGQGAAERVFTPEFLTLPSVDVSADNPASGHALGGDCRLYSDYKTGAVQVIQAPASRGAETRYGLVVNYADFDGSFLSLVVDGRSLLAGMPQGRARISVVFEARVLPQASLYSKCAWKVGDQWIEHKLEAKTGRQMTESFELPSFDPAAMQALDFHFIFNPQTRGSIDLRRLTIHLVIEPSQSTLAATSMFEAVVVR